MYGEKAVAMNVNPAPMVSVAAKQSIYSEMAHHLRAQTDTHDGYVDSVIMVAAEAIQVLQGRWKILEGDIAETNSDIELMHARNESRKQEIEFIKKQIERLNKLH